MFSFKNSAASKAAKDLIKSINELKARRATLISTRNRLESERDTIYRQPLRKEDIKQFLFDVIDKSGEDYTKLAKWPELFNGLAYPKRDPGYANNHKIDSAAICLHDVEVSLNSDACPPAVIFGHEFFHFFNSHLFGNGHAGFCFFFGDVLKAKIEQHFDEFFPAYHMEAKGNGTSIADRYDAIRDIDTNLSTINAELSDIDADLLALELSAKSARVKAQVTP